MDSRKFTRRAFLAAAAGHLAMLLIMGCDPSSPGPADVSFDPPLLRSLALSTNVIDTDSIFVGPERLPEDVLALRLIASVDVVRSTGMADIQATVKDATGHSLDVSYAFNDAGSYPDTAAADNRTTGTIDFTVERSETGVYDVRVYARDQSGLPGNALIAPLQLIRTNLPPAISALQADTLVSQSGGNTTLQLRLTASDPNGLDDIRRVWFDSFKPDGTAASGNPFLMFDDGNAGGLSGDIVADDGIYGLTIAFQGAATGTYRFVFRATDRSLDSSNVITHFLTVVP